MPALSLDFLGRGPGSVGRVLTQGGISAEELALAARNHGMPLEALRYDLTPPGLHYLLVHYDIPAVDPADYSLCLDGAVDSPLRLTFEDLATRPRQTETVTLECAGNGRARLEPRPVSQPWLHEAVGTAAWSGVSLAQLLEEAGVTGSALEVVFTGLDRGREGGVLQAYQRSLPLEDALRPEVILADRMNGPPLLPQHGAPLRLVVPGWYGMASVKWLERITVVEEGFQGYQHTRSYRIRRAEGDEGRPVTRIQPRSLVLPPGIPDFLTRGRLVEAGRVTVQGRAWSGYGPIESVQVSVDGGGTWQEARCDDPVGRFGWCAWHWEWRAEPGEYELASRATDATGRSQPLEAEWNTGGYEVNAVHRVPVEVVPAGRL